MKKFSFFLLVFLSMIFVATSCSKDDDSVPVTQSNITGFWRVTSFDGNSVPDGYYYAYFKSNGYYAIKFYDNTYVGTYRIESNTIIGTTLDPITEYFKITHFKGNTITIDYSNSQGGSHSITAVKEKSE
jgi:hypothetical protein